MKRVIVVVFKSEPEAFEGSKALGRLNLEGTIVVNQMVVVHKDRNGRLSTREVTDNSSVGAVPATVTGTVVGTLVGALAGPVGALVGGATAGLVGGAVDLGGFGIRADFVDEVSLSLIPGTTAVIADMVEEWGSPVDKRMTELGGVVLRRDLVGV